MLNADSRIDNANDKNIRRLRSAAQNYIDHNQLLLDKICARLLEGNV
jgi:hypothetical protein